MVIVFAMKGNVPRETIREDAIKRYNKIVKSPTYVRLFYDNGVPYLEGDKHISIANTGSGDDKVELVAIADEPVGIDIEMIDRNIKKDVAHRYFKDDELAYIGDNHDRFLEIWEKKEAYGKSLKVGLYLDSVMNIDDFREYDIYKGYKTILYTKEKDVFFVAM